MQNVVVDSKGEAWLMLGTTGTRALVAASPLHANVFLQGLE